MDFRDDNERETYARELMALAGSRHAKACAEHAVMVMRRCKGVDKEKIDGRVRSGKRHPPGPPVAPAVLDSLTFAANCAMATIPELKGNQPNRHRRTLHRQYIALALRLAVGSRAAAKALGVTPQGIRGGTQAIMREWPNLVERARADGAEAIKQQR